MNSTLPGTSALLGFYSASTIFEYVGLSVSVWVDMCIYTHNMLSLLHVYINAYAYMPTCVHVYVHAHVPIDVNVYECVYIYTYI